MADWLGLEWWRHAWVPILSGGLIWLASTWKNASDSRSARDARLDGRQEREIARKRCLGALLPNRADAVLPRLQVGSFEPTLWSTLVMTRVAADIAA